MRRATKLFIAGELVCAATAVVFARADLHDATARGTYPNVWDADIAGYTLGLDVFPHRPGEAGFAELWYHTPTSEDPTLVGRIYGAAALPGTPVPAQPEGEPGLCRTVLCPPLHPAPAPAPTPEPWVPWAEPPLDA